MRSVVVVSGGVSDEREVSLRSGQTVAQALKRSGYQVSHYDSADGNEGLMATAADTDVVFLALHGVGGEDGTLQKLFENNDIPFTGSGSQASQNCFDKWHYKEVLTKHSIPTPRGVLVDKTHVPSHDLFAYPFVMKPNDGGSSIDTFIIRNPLETDFSTLMDSFNRHKQMLVEELVSGTEITVGVLADQALPVIEIIPPNEQEFDYANKYSGTTQELCPPLHISPATQEAARTLALKIHSLLECKGVSRTDMIVDADNQLWVLETNTIPGMTEQSLLPKAALSANISLEHLVTILVEDALR